MARILVVDDESSIRRTLKDILEFEKHQVEIASNGQEALDFINDEDFDVVLLDIKMPEMDGMEVLERITKMKDIPVVMISGHGTIETAVQATRNGAFDLPHLLSDVCYVVCLYENNKEQQSDEYELDNHQGP